MDPLDDLLTQLEGVEEQELKPITENINNGPRAIDMREKALKAMEKPEKSAASSSMREVEEENSDDDELYVKKR